MKKFFLMVMLMVVMVMSCFGETGRGVIVGVDEVYDYCGKVVQVTLDNGITLRSRQWERKFNRSFPGDEVMYEVSGNTLVNFVNITKEFKRTTDGGYVRTHIFDWNKKSFVPCGSRVIGGSGYYGGGVVGTSGTIQTKNFGVSYDPNYGVNVRIGGGKNGIGVVNIPIRLKSKKSTTTSTVPSSTVTTTSNVVPSTSTTVVTSTTRTTSTHLPSKVGIVEVSNPFN